MKLTISRMMLIAAAALSFSSAGFAQEVNVRAKVPFSFVVGDKTYPAGEYAIQTAEANTFFLSIRNENGQPQGLTQSHVSTSSRPAEPANRAKLIFHRIANTYFLAQVWVGGSTVGREFPRSDRETEMATNRPKTETVIAAADIVH
jgi:hypothetical protein